jgi:hypothetical protein
MWWTPDGQRTLQGAERRLVREALGALVDMVRDDEGVWQFGAAPFDDLRPNQKLSLLAQIGSALFRDEEPMPPLTAALEAAVGAVYEAIRVMVEMEIDQLPEWRESPSWRELVLVACRERGIEEVLDAESQDLDEWEVMIASLADGVLWDEDWRDDPNLLDVDPEIGRGVKELLGIDKDYYVAVPPDPTDEEMEGIWKTLHELTRNTEEPR